MRLLQSAMFSRRTRWDRTPNRLSLLLEAKRRAGSELLDLTESDSEHLRGRAAQAVMRMTGRQRPYTSAASEEERRILVRHMRNDWNEIQRATPEDREELFRRLRESNERKP